MQSRMACGKLSSYWIFSGSSDITQLPFSLLSRCFLWCSIAHWKLFFLVLLWPFFCIFLFIYLPLGKSKSRFQTTPALSALHCIVDKLQILWSWDMRTGSQLQRYQRKFYHDTQLANFQVDSTRSAWQSTIMCLGGKMLRFCKARTEWTFSICSYVCWHLHRYMTESGRELG